MSVSETPRPRAGFAAAPHAVMATAGPAHDRGGDPTKPVVHEDFLAKDVVPAGADDSLDAEGGHYVNDPYDLYEKAAS